MDFHELSSFQKRVLIKIKPGEKEKQRKSENLEKIRKYLTDIIRKILTKVGGGFFPLMLGNSRQRGTPYPKLLKALIDVERLIEATLSFPKEIDLNVERLVAKFFYSN